MKNTIKLTSVLLAMILIFASLTGCKEVEKSEAAVSGMFTELKNKNLDGAKTYLNTDEITIDDNVSDEYIKIAMDLLFDKLDYNIISAEKIDNNTVIVKTQVTALDMKPIISDVFMDLMKFRFSSEYSANMTMEAIQNKVIDILKSSIGENSETVTTEVDIKVVKEGKSWKVAGNDELADAVMGKITEAADGLGDILNNFGSAK